MYDDESIRGHIEALHQQAHRFPTGVHKGLRFCQYHRHTSDFTPSNASPTLPLGQGNMIPLSQMAEAAEAYVMAMMGITLSWVAQSDD